MVSGCSLYSLLWLLLAIMATAPEEELGAVGGDPGTTVTSMPSEQEMLRILAAKYDFTPKCTVPPPTTSVSDTGAKDKIAPLMSLATQPTPSFVHQPLASTPSQFAFSPMPSNLKVPKIPSFSGDIPTPKSEISFYEWRHEVRCLRKDVSLSHSQVPQAMRSSLRGTARRLVVSLGESVTVDSVLKKLEVNFSEPTSKGVNMREFFNCSQRPDESVTSFGCRLESILDQAFEVSKFQGADRSEMLCERLWSGLRSESLRTNTRHKFDSATDYDFPSRRTAS